MSDDTKPADVIPATSQALAARTTDEQIVTTADNDFIEFGDDTGIGVMSRDDVQMARLAIAQGMSPQVSEVNAAYIPDLKIGHMFNTLNGTIYGKGPVEFALVRRDEPRWAEFDENLNLVDKDVPPDDKRTEWRPATTPGGKRVPPVATQFYDYVAVMLATNDIVILSLARSGVKAAKKLNGLVQEAVPVQTTKGMTMKLVPLFAKRYRAEVVQAPVPAGRGTGTYGVFKFEYAGLITNRDMYGSLKGLSAAMATKDLNIDRAQAAADNAAGDGDVIDQPTGSAPSM